MTEPNDDEGDILQQQNGKENHCEEHSQSTMMMARFKEFQIHSKISQFIVYSLISPLIWVVLLVIVGKDDLPGGTVFVLVLLECGGRLLGHLVSLIHVPPMVGMLGLGIAIGNISFLDLTQRWNPALSSPIRQIALAVILTRAGFGLDLNTLIKFKWLVLRLAVVPTVIESLTIAFLTHFLLGFPWMWGILVGFVVAAVSPAVIVPRILELKAQGYGEKKGVPTVVLASASLDNVVAISFFGVALGFIFSSKGTLEMLLQCPLEVVSGCGFGFIWGAMNAVIFNPSGNTPDADESVAKGIFVLGGGIISILGFKLLDYSGAGALGCIISAFVTSTIWKYRGFSENEINQIKWGFTFLWKFFEPLLFGVIGLQIVIADLDGKTVLLSVGCLIAGAFVRFITTYLTVCSAGLSTREKLFIAISWVPKATVQAAIGPIALDYVKNMQSGVDTQLEQLATQVLTIAVVVILLTAPIGEFAVIFSGPRLLSKDKSSEARVTQSRDDPPTTSA
ncbi:Mitochondrial sodium/hydrogen exchanger 9B2 [Orchesella cincta]|uniref:Mitochondrial sodium/hydrogen exchanger 9B2 n=1 Tax=Orchesella cincta TaxID=48709 RepID=A0A1D2NCI4_ORCCI|nr:Mitochondrial sodium/hydrogen exchanger 9B2 [Orchesella cincta]